MDDSKREQRTSQEIRRDIEATRAELRETVDALERKLSVSHIVDELLGKVSEGDVARRTAATVGGAIKEHPVPSALFGLGAAWLAMDKVRGSDPDTNNTHFSSDFAENSNGANEKMTSTLADKATDAASEAKDKLKDKRGISSLVDKQPLALGAVAFGLGLASGLMIPTSRWENETLGEAAEAVKDEASEMATEAVEGAKGIAAEAASGAIETVKEKARAKNQEPDGLRRRGRGANSMKEGSPQR